MHRINDGELSISSDAVEGRTKLNCDICGKRCETKAEFRRHVMYEHSTSQGTRVMKLLLKVTLFQCKLLKKTDLWSIPVIIATTTTTKKDLGI